MLMMRRLKDITDGTRHIWSCKMLDGICFAIHLGNYSDSKVIAPYVICILCI